MKKYLILFLMLSALFACNTNGDKAHEEESALSKKEINPDSLVPKNKKSMYQVADTLFYTALLKAGTEEEALYMDDWVKNLKLKEFTDLIFDAVYSGRLTAYSYISEEPMSIEEVKALEEENKENAIAKVLFEEAWYFDEENLQLYKEVRSVMLAYERKDSEGKVRGYKSGIKIFTGNKKPREPEQKQ
jgi:hypothetical protein